MKQLRVTIKTLQKVTSDTYMLAFSSPYLARRARPGNFLHVKVRSTILRRPFSIHSVSRNNVRILFRIKGRGTRALAGYRKSMTLDVIGPLGRGFRLPDQNGDNRRVILVAGGIGVAPLVFLAEQLKKIKNPKSIMENAVLLGAKNKNEIICEKNFKRLGYNIFVATDDGSRGYKGTVNDLLAQELRAANDEQRTAIYACGPEAMLHSIYTLLKSRPSIECQVAFEQFMGCGLGVCCACVIKTKQGYQKVCKDGPVFDINDIW